MAHQAPVLDLEPSVSWYVGASRSKDCTHVDTKVLAQKITNGYRTQGWQ